MATNPPPKAKDALASVRISAPRSADPVEAPAPEARASPADSPAAEVEPPVGSEQSVSSELARRLALREEKMNVVVAQPTITSPGAVYVCESTQTVCIRANIVTLKPGTLLSDAKFGTGVVDILRNAGVRMRLVEA